MSMLSNLPKLSKNRKRVGRGGDHGGTSCRGSNGQKSRQGGKSEIKPSFEGGQMSLARRIPRRGFNNPFATPVSIVNLADLERMFEADQVVDEASLREKYLVKKRGVKIKVLGKGQLTKALTIKVDAVSASACEAIEKAGGKVVLGGE